MKLSEARGAYYEHSGKASELTRSLAFAGLAVVWIFKVGEGGNADVPLEFLAPAFFLVVTLASDFLQYVSQTLVWGAFHRIRERGLKKINSDPEILAPRWLNWPGLFFFWGKLILLAVSYWLLIAGVGAVWSSNR